jgi:hypothetical protein
VPFRRVERSEEEVGSAVLRWVVDEVHADFLQASSVSRMQRLADTMPEPVAAVIDVCTYGVLSTSELFGSARATSPGPPPEDAGVAHITV